MCGFHYQQEAQLHNNNECDLKQKIASLHKETTLLQHENNSLNANIRKSKSELNRCKSELLKVKEETNNNNQQEIQHLKVRKLLVLYYAYLKNLLFS